MTSVDQLRKSYGEYGRGRLAIKILRAQAAHQPVSADDLAQAIGTGEFERDRGNPGHIAAVRPAIVLSAISTFEGFVEEFLAEALAASGHTLARIAKELGGNNLNNPSVEAWEKLVGRHFNPISINAFSVTVDRYTKQSNFHSTDSLGWADAKAAANGWMSVRHIITHGGQLDSQPNYGHRRFDPETSRQLTS